MMWKYWIQLYARTFCTARGLRPKGFYPYTPSTGTARLDVKTRCEYSNGGSNTYGPKAFFASMSAVEDAGCTVDGSGVITCEEPTNCPFVNGEKFFKQGSGTAPDNLNDQECAFEKCGANISMDGGWMGNYCVTGNAEGGDDDVTTGLNCVQTSGGTQYCADTTMQDENCGTINGEYVCLGSVPDGACTFFGSGSAICTSGSQTNTPDETITDQDGNEFDLFESGDTGGTAGGSGSTSGTTDNNGDGVADTGAQGEGDCPAWEDCDETHSGSVPGIPDDGCPDFNCINQNFWNTVSQGPLMSTVNSYSFQSGSSECPAPSMVLFGSTLTFDMHCVIGNDIRSSLSVIFLGLWLLVATRIFLGA